MPPSGDGTHALARRAAGTGSESPDDTQPDNTVDNAERELPPPPLLPFISDDQLLRTSAEKAELSRQRDEITARMRQIEVREQEEQGHRHRAARVGWFVLTCLSGADTARRQAAARLLDTGFMDALDDDERAQFDAIGEQIRHGVQDGAATTGEPDDQDHAAPPEADPEQMGTAAPETADDAAERDHAEDRESTTEGRDVSTPPPGKTDSAGTDDTDPVGGHDSTDGPSGGQTQGDDSPAELTLESILDCLNRETLRCRAGAVGLALGLGPRGLNSVKELIRESPRPAAEKSWVVSKDIRTPLLEVDRHPEFDSRERVITDAAALRQLCQTMRR